ncbi:hypothetical protein GCM10019016_070150 [Streptomyces prasinosporus]|uniref:Uncharacterized protein n=1 Tax=Streptomyces prasinosporus TaxID=68256 RepID=A0ABP6TYT2_9ACTN
MPERDTISRTTGATALTLAALACAVGLAEALRRGLGRRSGSGRRTRECERVEAVRRHGRPGGTTAAATAATSPVPATPVIPRQRQTGPRAEAVRLTAAERDAFAVLVRRFGEGG